MQDVKSLFYKSKKLENNYLDVSLVVIRENYGSVPDKRYLKEDFEWLQKNYKANQQPNITREFLDSNNIIAADKFTSYEMLLNRDNNFKGFICFAGKKLLSINNNGNIDPCVASRKLKIGKYNAYSKHEYLEKLNGPIVCPFDSCYVPQDMQIPKINPEYFKRTEIKVKNFYSQILIKKNSDQEIIEAEQYINEGKYIEARKLLCEILEKDINNIDVLNDLTVTSILEGNIEKALSYLQTVLSMEPNNDIAKNNANYINKNINSFKSFNDNDSLINESKNKRIKEFESKLIRINWQNKLNIYSEVFEYSNEIHKIANPQISIIVISWRLHQDNIKSFQILERQRNQNFQLIFVDNGANEGEFNDLKPFVDTYIKLNQNTGAYLARNIGAVFAKAPIIFFLEDDGIPEENILEAHLNAFQNYDIIACRGAYIPKSQNHLNRMATHYYLGDKPFPIYADLEGNTTYKAKAFFKVGGWDDEIKFGRRRSRSFYSVIQPGEPDKRKQIYIHDAIIYHDFAKDEIHREINWPARKLLE